MSEWRCNWKPDELNPGPDCPYCADEMCARIDGIMWGCRHTKAQRHGYGPADPSCRSCQFKGYACREHSELDPVA